VAGVCAGLGKYLYVDVSLVRIVFTLLLLSISPIAITVYVVAWIIIPPGPTIPDERLYADDFDDDELN
jgi:phage shock protein PspC (stress-responsive transcriptional regulator)